MVKVFNFQTINALCLTLLCTLSLLGCQQEPDDSSASSPAAPQMPPAAVTTIMPQRGDMQQGLTVVGSLVASAQAIISAEVAGRVEQVAAVDGQFVEAGSLLFSINASALSAELKGTQAEVRLRQDEIKRVKELVKKRVASDYDLDKANALLDSALAKVELAQAMLAQASIVAPFSGFLGITKINQGEYVDAGTPLINLVSLQPLYVDFQVPETALSAMTVGGQLTVIVPALKGLETVAQVSALEPEMNESTRSIMVRAIIDNADGLLRPGLFARVKIPLQSAENILWLPEAALFLKGGSHFVLVNDDGKAVRKAVEVLSQQHGRVAIAAGISETDEVVVGGHHKVPFDGMALMVVNAEKTAEDETSNADHSDTQ